jgi:prepilin-type processing-associated H-X9-DG protein
VAQLKQSARAIVIAEGRRGVGNAGWNQLSTWEVDTGVVLPTFTAAQRAPETNVAYDRHSLRPDDRTNPKFDGRSNFVFADGHAESLEYKHTWDAGIGTRGAGTGAYPNMSMWRQLYPSGAPADRY